MPEYAKKKIELKIGVTGYSVQKFDEEKAINMINDAFDNLNNSNINKSKVVVSGLTNIGIPALAYREAVKRGWKTVGIACSKVKDYETFPVNEKIIVGNEWGEESQEFLKNIDVLVRIGSGKQSTKEAEEMKKKGKPVFEYDLPIVK